ncbi:MAG: hypothetical protein K1X44_02340 [Alphaproteobacteria bacterium]|nr:hypothetical protein [Alphaproteobacteria bacterium]
MHKILLILGLSTILVISQIKEAKAIEFDANTFSCQNYYDLANTDSSESFIILTYITSYYHTLHHITPPDFANVSDLLEQTDQYCQIHHNNTLLDAVSSIRIKDQGLDVLSITCKKHFANLFQESAQVKKGFIIVYVIGSYHAITQRPEFDTDRLNNIGIKIGFHCRSRDNWRLVDIMKLI